MELKEYRPDKQAMGKCENNENKTKLYHLRIFEQQFLQIL